MKTFFRLFSCLVGAAVLVTSIGCSMASEQTVTGFIQATETDDNDNPKDIYLFDGKDEYMVKKSTTRDELLELLDRKISVTGKVSEEWGGKKAIEVESYKVLD